VHFLLGSGKCSSAVKIMWLLPILLKYAVSQVIGFIKGKSAIYMALAYGEGKRNFVDQHIWARG